MTQMISKVGVVGAGTMGHGIAHVSALAGHSVALYDLKPELTAKGLEHITRNLDVGVEKKKVTPEARAAALERITTTTDLKDLAGCELVIEAAPEKIELKQHLFRDLSHLVSKDCIL